jgi:integrase
MVELLTRHRALQLVERRTAANLCTDTGFVFATELGQPADPRNLLRATTIASKKAGLPPVGVHTLRHT